jgi:hypothetical protein
MLDPSTKLQHVYFGDSSGNVFQMEGDSWDGDGGTTEVKTNRTSQNIVIPAGHGYDFTGWVRYRGGSDVTLKLTFELGGRYAYNQSIDITLPAGGTATYWGGDNYFGGNSYFGSLFEGRLVEQLWSVAGQATELKVSAEVTSDNDFSIAEIGLEFRG